ncbi:hypothetical protein KBC80_05615 [Candidatus Woesebacteria bacterium]|nr:hypothetical protein [Candidatus Woesebacteria bacterium]
MEISALIVADGLCPDILLTLSSVSELAKEIVIVDIGLDPQTKQKIKTDYPSTRFFWLEKPEYVELIRQKSLEFTVFPWVLLLDPDEYLSPDLVRYVKEIDEKVIAEHSHFRIPRQNYIFGKWIAHSRWWPDYQVRLFRKESMDWPQKLHAQPVLLGKGYIVPAFENEKLEMNARTIVHHNYTSIMQYLEKNVRYARVESREIIEADKEYTVIDATRKATSEFISRFFADKGYKDGMHGFVLALLQAFYSILVFLDVWEKRGYQDASQTVVLRGAEQFFVKTSREMFYWLQRDRLTKGKDAIIGRIRSKLL